MKFTKMQALGNDYIYIDCFKYEVKNADKVAVKVSDRHFGIGGDGLILVKPSDIADVCMEMYNMDGSRAEMCGNGARCVAKFAYDKGYVKKDKFTLESMGKIRYIEVKERHEDGSAKLICINMGKPLLYSELPEKIDIAGIKREFVGIDVGNPHAVYYVDSKLKLEKFDITAVGSLYENHERFENKVNSEFIFVENRNSIYMRVWERGSGETLACGTGATASAYACMLMGYCDNNVTVHLLGGDLFIEYDEQSKDIFMTGPAEYVFDGETEI